MFRVSSVAGSAVVGTILLLAPTASASPADDQFMNEVLRGRYMKECSTVNNTVACVSLPQAFGGLISAAKAGCFFLNEGRNPSEAMSLTTQGLKGSVNDPIGFMLAATRAYCPQFSYMYSGL
jgi:hypothetical protein